MITIDPIIRPSKKSSSVDTTQIMKEVDQKFSNLIGEAPENLDTIKELANAVENIPTKTSQLENDVPYVLKSEVEVKVEVRNGVYIVDLDGNLLDPKVFIGTADDVTGIGLITDNGKWIVALDEWFSSTLSTSEWNGNTKSAWGGQNIKVTGCFTSNYENKALLDFDGETNTNAIIAQLKGTSDGESGYIGAPAAEYCRAYSKGYKGVGEWYLPSAGEYNEVVLNKDAISVILTKLGKKSLLESYDTWSSSQYDKYYAWFYDWNNSNWTTHDKKINRVVRPICKLEQLKKSLKGKVSEIEFKTVEIEDHLSNVYIKSEVDAKILELQTVINNYINGTSQVSELDNDN